METQYKSYDEAVNELSGGRGYAFLTGAQKTELGNTTFADNSAILSPTGFVKSSEPTVISTDTARDNFEKDVQPTIDGAHQAQQTTQQNQLNQPVTPPPTTEQLLAQEGESELDKINRQRSELYDKQKADLKNTYDQMTVMNTDVANAQKASLTAQWEERRRLLEESNKANLATWQQQFIRSGQSEYSPGMTSDFVSAKEQEGIRKVKELDNQYNSAVAQIDAAMKAKNFELAATLSGELMKIEQKALDQAEANAREAAAVNAQMQESMRGAKIASGVADLVSKGLTDPVSLLGGLNSMGLAIDSTELEKAMKVFVPEIAEVDDPMMKLSGDMKDFYILKNQGLLAGIDDPFEYIRQKSAAGRAPIVAKGTSTGFGGGGGSGGLPAIGDKTSQAITLGLEALKFGSVSAKNDAEETIRQLLLEGNVELAKEQLMNYAYNSASATQQDVLDGKKNTLLALGNIEQQLAEFVSKGGNTGVFTGLTDRGLQKVGRTVSPELAEIANSIGIAIVDYRRAVSGAAFTESEAQAYEKLFPSIGKTSELNQAKINSLKAKFTSDIEQFAKNKIGATKYDMIFGDQAEITPSKDPELQLKDVYNSAPNLRTTIEKMINDGLSTSEILQIVN